MLDGAHDRIRCEATQSAERSELHSFGQIGEQREIRLDIFACNNLVNRLDATCAAQAARRTFAAAFNSTKLHRKARHLRHVDGIVEHRDTSMADQRIGSSKTARTSNPQQEQRVGKCAENVYDANCGLLQRSSAAHSGYVAATAAATTAAEFARIAVLVPDDVRHGASAKVRSTSAALLEIFADAA